MSEDSITYIYCLIDDPCHYFDRLTQKYAVGNKPRESLKTTLGEVINMMVVFCDGNSRDIKHFYPHKVKLYWTGLFTTTVFLNRSVGAAQTTALYVALFLKPQCPGNGTETSFMDPILVWACKSKRDQRDKVSKDIAITGKLIMAIYKGLSFIWWQMTKGGNLRFHDHPMP